jgi:hypothetical protein
MEVRNGNVQRNLPRPAPQVTKSSIEPKSRGSLLGASLTTIALWNSCIPRYTFVGGGTGLHWRTSRFKTRKHGLDCLMRQQLRGTGIFRPPQPRSRGSSPGANANYREHSPSGRSQQSFDSSRPKFFSRSSSTATSDLVGGTQAQPERAGESLPEDLLAQ